jgi:hypothetical protein
MQLPEIAVGAVVAATIAAVISLLGLIITKEQKVSEFRQAWIDALRTELSSLIAHLNAMHSGMANNAGSSAEDWGRVREDYIGANRYTASIRLRLNPDEPKNQKVLAALEQLESKFSAGGMPSHEELDRIEKQLVAAAQFVLKSEWVRVREGERVYRVARLLTGFVIAAAVLSLLLTGL